MRLCSNKSSISLVSLFVFVLLCILVPAAVQSQALPRYPTDNNDIPQGSASLAFVFDVTGSMYDDLVQVNLQNIGL